MIFNLGRRANNASTPLTLVRISQSNWLIFFSDASMALKLLGGLISMVGISMTSAPRSRSGPASPPDCLLARVVRIRQPLSGSSFFSDFAEKASWIYLRAAWVPGPLVHRPLPGSDRLRAAVKLAPHRGQDSRYCLHQPARAESHCHPDAQPWRAGAALNRA